MRMATYPQLTAQISKVEEECFVSQVKAAEDPPPPRRRKHQVRHNSYGGQAKRQAARARS